MKKFLVILFVIQSSIVVAQKKPRILYGSIAALKGQATVNTAYTYDSMIVGVDKLEKDFITEKKKSWDLKEAGKGDEWEAMWYAERKKRYEPAFDHYLKKTTGLNINKGNPQYTLIIKTRRTEPGWNAGVVVQSPEIDVEVWLVDATDGNKVLAKIIMVKQRGRNPKGGDFEMGLRLQEAYMEAANTLGTLVAKTL